MSAPPILPDERELAAPLPVLAPLLVTVEEAADALRLSRTATYELISSNQLRTVTIGRRRRVPVAALEEFVAQLSGVAL